jgi:signal transduction histidine kinase
MAFMSNVIRSDNVFQPEKPDFKDGERLLDELPLGLFKCSADGELEYANRFLCRWLNENDKLTPKDEESFRKQISHQVKECLDTGKSSWAKMRACDNSDLVIRVFPVKDEAKKPKGAVGWVEDIASLSNLQSNLQRTINELSILCELGTVLRGTLKLEEILQIILIGVTAGQGLGFNRAFLLLLDQKETRLEGKMAIGPSNSEEAKRIWDSLSTQEQSLEEVLHSYKNVLKEKDVLVNQMVKKIKIPVSDQKNPLIQSMLNKRAFHIIRGGGEEDENLFEVLQTNQLAVAPLISKGRMLGVIVADNLITQKPIEDEAVKLLSICAHNASAAIETSQLYQQLEEKVNKLAEAKRRIEESTQRLLKVERLSVLGQITSQVAHELRNPLTVIGGFAHSILKKMEPQNPDYEYVKIISNETERMENVLNHVLDFSKTDKSHLEMVNLNDLVDQTFEMMETEIDSTKISIFKSFSPDLSLIRVNPDLIRQALLNMFRNAIWAMPQGGILSVVTRQADGLVKIEVKDTGFGIPAENKDSIFNAFFTTKPDACGLGLTVSAEIIKNHGGNIGVESVEGKGSTFFVELPSTEEVAPRPSGELES